MAVFLPIYFTWTTKYPDSGTRIGFARSYAYTAGPTAPDQRIFNLKLQGMQYFLNASQVIDTTVFPERNLALFEQFYRNHYLHQPFDFNHPVYGMLQCKFNRPLELPEGVPGGNGMIETLEVELIEQP